MGLTEWQQREMDAYGTIDGVRPIDHYAAASAMNRTLAPEAPKPGIETTREQAAFAEEQAFNFEAVRVSRFRDGRADVEGLRACIVAARWLVDEDGNATLFDIDTSDWGRQSSADRFRAGYEGDPGAYRRCAIWQALLDAEEHGGLLRRWEILSESRDGVELGIECEDGYLRVEGCWDEGRPMALLLASTIPGDDELEWAHR